VCIIPAGTGRSRPVTVRDTSTNRISTSVTFDYTDPVINSVSPTSIPTSGAPITLSGSSFGGTTSQFRYVIGSTTFTTGVTSVSHTQIVLQIPAGMGTQTLYVVVGPSDQTSNTVVISYMGPSIASVSPANGPTVGDTTITISGQNFGTAASVLVGSSACSIVSQTHTIIRCKTPSGAGIQKLVKVAVASLSSSEIVNFNYDPPSISSVTPSTLLTQGGQVITLTGVNFHTGGLINVGSSACTSPVYVNDATVRCTAPAGDGANVPVVITVSEVASNTWMLNYQVPTITTISPANGPTIGGTRVTVTGSNFGLFGRVSIGGASCTDFSHTHTTIVCYLPAGMGATNAVIVTQAGGQESTNSVNFAYNPPVISSLNPTSSPTNGGGNLVISGSNFGVSGTVILGGTSCSAVGSGFAQTSITCQIPQGQGANVPLVVTVGGQSTTSTAFSYNPPALTSVSGSTPTGGGVLITLIGTSFGLAGGSVSIGGQNCPVSAGSRTHSQILCTLPAGRGSVPVTFTVDSRTSNSITLNYDSPSITGVSPAIGPTAGGTTITIAGESFDSSGSVQVNGNTCVMVSYSHTSITCKTPAGFGVSKMVTVTAVSGKSSSASLFSYSAPQISSLNPTSGSTTGDGLLTINGANFASSAAPSAVTISGVNCPITSQTDVRILCTLPAGEGVGKLVTVSIDSQLSNSAQFNYRAPTLSTISPANGNTEGGYLLTLAGSNFGASSQVSVGDSDCPIDSRSTAHDTITCTCPPGQGSDRSVQVTVASQISNLLFFSYNGPSVSSISPTNGPTAGTIPLTINGNNFGSSGYITVNGVSCPATSHTSFRIICTLPEGEGSQVDVQVVIGSVSSNIFTFAYDAPAITSLNPANGPTQGGTVIVINGVSWSFLSLRFPF